MCFSVTGAHVGVVLFYFVYPLVEAQGWIVDTAGHEGGYTQQGLGCWPTIGFGFIKRVDKTKLF